MRLKKDGYKVISADWKKQEYFEEVCARCTILTLKSSENRSWMPCFSLAFADVSAFADRGVWVSQKDFCDEFHLLDLRSLDNCLKVCQGVDWVYMLAADMGGMGFIQSNHSRILYNNTMISFNMVEAARQHKVFPDNRVDIFSRAKAIHFYFIE